MSRATRMIDHSQSHALITGASQGLGLAIARAYVQAGASVMMCARDAALLESRAGRAGAHRAAASSASPRRAPTSRARATSNGWSRPRSPRSAAAHPRQQRRRLRPDGADRDGRLGRRGSRAIEINIYGSVLPCRALLPHFKQQRYGKIVQLSGGGATNPLPRISAYAASKAAIVRFAETLALEVKDDRHRRQRDRAGRARTRGCSTRCSRPGPTRSGEAFYERMVKTQRRGRHAARDGRRAGGVPRIGGERRHHRPAAQRGLGSVGRRCRSIATISTRPTSTRCAASCPRIAA